MSTSPTAARRAGNSCSVGVAVKPVAVPLKHVQDDDCEISDVLVADVLSAVRSDALAIMVYGSHARGTANSSSDVDVLEVVPRDPRSYSAGRLNVTGYTPPHLTAMAQASSLFALHLVIEGRVITDSHNILANSLRRYVQPSSYAPHKRELLALAAALDISREDFQSFGQSVGRLGIYLVRTVAYARCIEASVRTFDLHVVCRTLRLHSLETVLGLRSPATVFRLRDLALMRSCIEELLDQQVHNDYGGLVALGVALSVGYPRANALLSSLLSGSTTVDYTTIAAAPF